MTASRIAAFLALSALACMTHAADLSVRVDDVRHGDGKLMLALYDSADTFLKKPVRTLDVPAVAGGATLQLKDLAPGRYALAVYHDADGNGKMNRNAMGVPSEDYGFSNNALGFMGPPAFDDARFDLPEAGAQLRVSLR
jgi:uncharacterized protein (DUF2141 family)